MEESDGGGINSDYVDFSRLFDVKIVQSIFVSHFLSNRFFSRSFYLHLNLNLHTFLVKCELKTIAPATFVTPFFQHKYFFLSLSNLTSFFFGPSSSCASPKYPFGLRCDVLHLRKNTYETSFLLLSTIQCAMQWPRQIFKFRVWFLVHLLSWHDFTSFTLFFFSSLFFVVVVSFCTWTVFFSFIHEFAHNFVWKRVCFCALRFLCKRENFPVFS